METQRNIFHISVSYTAACMAMVCMLFTPFLAMTKGQEGKDPVPDDDYEQVVFPPSYSKEHLTAPEALFDDLWISDFNVYETGVQLSRLPLLKDGGDKVDGMFLDEIPIEVDIVTIHDFSPLLNFGSSATFTINISLLMGYIYNKDEPDNQWTFRGSVIWDEDCYRLIIDATWKDQYEGWYYLEEIRDYYSKTVNVKPCTDGDAVMYADCVDNMITTLLNTCLESVDKKCYRDGGFGLGLGAACIACVLSPLALVCVAVCGGFFYHNLGNMKRYADWYTDINSALVRAKWCCCQYAKGNIDEMNECEFICPPRPPMPGNPF